MLKFGGDLLQIACVNGRKEIVELLQVKGCDVLGVPPERVQGDESYRKSPFVIQAAQSGHLDTFNHVLECGGTL